MNQFKCQMTSEGINVVLVYFDTNYRPNLYLAKKISEITLEDLNKDEIILDESYLAKLDDKEEIDKYITTTLIDDAHFFNFDLKDDIFGNSLKEVIRKKPKRWMIYRMERQGMIPRPRRFFSLNDFINKFDEEHRRRGRFLYGPRFGLLDPRRMHRRRRLGFGFPFGGFPFGPYPGPGPRHFSPFGPRPPFGRFGPVPPSMRPYSLPPHGPFGPHHPHFMPPTPFPHYGFPHGPSYPHMMPPRYPYTPYMPHGPISFYDDYNLLFGRGHIPHGPRYIPYGPHFMHTPKDYYERTEYVDDNYENEIDQNYYLTEGNINKQQKQNVFRAKDLDYDDYSQQYDDLYEQKENEYYENYIDYNNKKPISKPKKNIKHTINIKTLTSKIPVKYLRKDLIAPSSNYITHQTVPCRPQKKQEEECEQDQQEYEQGQQDYEKGQQDYAQEQAEYELQQQEILPEQQEIVQQQQEIVPEQQENVQGQQEVVLDQQENIQAQQGYEQGQQEYENQIIEQKIVEEQVQQQQEAIEEVKQDIQGAKQEEVNEQKIEEEKKEEHEEDILIPDEHPEEHTTLEELDEQLESLKKLLEDDNLKEEERKTKKKS